MKPVQYFSDDYLEQSKAATPDEVLAFLDSFRKLQEKPSRSKLISLKVQEPLLDSFRHKCELEGIKYQTQIKLLMEKWLTA